MKKIGQTIYYGLDEFIDAPADLHKMYHSAVKILRNKAQDVYGDANLFKFDMKNKTVSFLSYEEFWKIPHPWLNSSCCVNLMKKTATMRFYHSYKSRNDWNPPILHRKELFISKDHSEYEKWARLTEQEEMAGLLNRKDIGRRDQWNKLLDKMGLRIDEVVSYELRKVK